MNGEVLIVDEHTGRILAGRRYNEGMHQAIEAKEGVEIKQENQTLATITLQNYFRLYDKLSGMTGTAMTEAAEFNQIYKLGVVPIPTNHADDPRRRGRPRLPDRGGQVRRGRRRHRRAAREGPADPGRHRQRGEVRVPVDAAAQARRPARGAQRQAARARGADRRAGRPARARSRSRRTWPAAAPTSCSAATPSSWRPPSSPSAGCPRSRPPRSTRRPGRARSRRPRRRSRPSTTRSSTSAASTSSGTERHESRRIDNQLRGRSGRQGDPGESRFYLSLEDDLMRLFKGNVVDSFLTRFNIPDDVPIEAKMVTNAIQVARRPRSRRRTSRSARTSSSTTTCSTASARSSTRSAAGCSRATTSTSRSGTWSTTRSRRTSPRRRPRASPRSGTSTSSGPRSARCTRSALTVDELVEASPAASATALTSEYLVEELRRGRPGGVRPARGGARRGGDARAGAPRRALRARPQVARAPVRDGLPAGGHRPARDGPARPARGVPARGLRPVRGDDGRDQGGVGRLPVQPRGPGGRRGGRPDRTGARHGERGPDAVAGPPALPTDSEPEPPAQKLPPALRAKGLDVSRPSHVEYSAPSLDGDGVVHRSAEGVAGADGEVEVDPNANRAERRRQQRAQRKKR